MAHRRKNAHPLCKQKRISTVVDLLAAKSKQECLRTESPLDVDNGTSKHKVANSDLATHHSDTLDAMRQKIDVPEDLFKQFLALKSATNLDTTELMRKLIKDMDSEIGKQKDGHEEGNRSPNKSDAEKLSEYYREQEDRYVLKDDTSEDGASQKSQPLDLRALRAEYFQNGLENLQNGIYRQNYTYLFDSRNFDGNSASGKNNDDVMDNNEANDSMEAKSTDGGEECREVEFQNGSLKIQGTKHNPKIQMEDKDSGDRGPPPPYPYTHVPGAIPFLPSAIPGMIPIGTVPEGYPMISPGLQGAIPMLQPNISPESLHMMNSAQTNPMISGGINEHDDVSVSSASKFRSSPDEEDENRHANADMSEESISQLWNPMQAKRTFFKSINPKKKNTDKKKMILIAENTSNHGVYTSVLKLPWSRRTRTPKAEVGHPPNVSSQTGNRKNAVQEETEVEQQSQMHAHQNNLQQPSYVFVPYPAVSLPNSQGMFIPSSLPGVSTAGVMETHPSTTQSMMMVYPNQNLNSSGKPVRKRGRPPKTPTMAKMLNENKKLKYEASMPTFIQNFSPCQPPAAIVLNVNNMLNTGNAVTASNNITSMPVSGSPEHESQQNMTHSVVKEEPTTVKAEQEDPEYTAANNTATDSKINKLKEIAPKIRNMDDIKHLQEKEKEALEKQQDDTEKTEVDQGTDDEMKMVTTTTMANASTGALYQEMILSSKSFVNARARGRRQSTNEILRSKSEAQNFLCTSFRLRSLSGNKKEKKTIQYVPGMKRRGRPPKKRLENMFEGQMVEVSQEKLDSINDNIALSHMNTSQQAEISRGFKKNSFDPRNLKQEHEGFVGNMASNIVPFCGREGSPPESNSSDEQTNANEMFQQLFHCKLCNEIVPVDLKESHWLKHSKKNNNKCSTCGGSYQKFVFREKEDSEPVQMLKCENCERVVAAKNEAKIASSVDSLSVSCVECGDKFPSYNMLQQHIATNHPKTSSQQYQSSNILQKLSQKVTPEDSDTPSKEKVYECQEASCTKTYHTKMDLYAHVQRRHGGNQQVYCIYEGCDKKFPSDLHMQEHIQFKHLNAINLKYKCSWTGCDEEFATERQLKIHLLVHQDEKPLSCVICDGRFRQKSALMWHLRKHHPEVNNSDNLAEIDEEQQDEESQ